VVLPAQNEAEIASGLIQASTTHMKAASAHWLEVCFDFSGARMTPELKAYYHKYKSWYEVCGAELLEEYVYMTCSTSGFEHLSKGFLKDGFHIESFTIQDKDEVYRCFYDAFINGNDHSFLKRTEGSRRVMFDKYFDDPENINKEASLILSKQGFVVGFCVFKTRPNVGDEHLVLLCIHPDHQREGLGTQLLSFSISKISQTKRDLISLGVDINNFAALKLYRKLGFQTHSKFITYICKNECVS
jgi:ribosomal protein S18 acetylase RimI-like enzyme